MKPVKFKEAQTLLSAPEGWEDSIKPLWTATSRLSNGQKMMTSCWQPSWKDRIRVLMGWPVWHHTLGDEHPPIEVTTDLPFEREGEVDLKQFTDAVAVGGVITLSLIGAYCCASMIVGALFS